MHVQLKWLVSGLDVVQQYIIACIEDVLWQLHPYAYAYAYAYTYAYANANQASRDRVSCAGR